MSIRSNPVAIVFDLFRRAAAFPLHPQNIRTRIGAVPFCNLSLKAKKPRCNAAIIECDDDTITNWENGRRSPTISHTAKIADFWDTNPFREGTTLAERLVKYRRARDCGRRILPASLASIQAPLRALSAGSIIRLESTFPQSRRS
jgi:hypothetical protein